MKKLLAFSFLLMLVTVSFLTGSPLPMLLQVPGNWTILGLSTDASAITAYADEHKRPLIATLVNGLDIAKDILVIPNVKNKIQLSKVTVGNGLRPYSSTHEPKTNHVGFTDRELSTKTGKLDLLIDIKSFKDKHLAWRTSPGNNANKTFNDLEFAPFVWGEIIKGVQREMNDETAYFGFDKATAVAYNAGNAYVVGDYVTFTVDSLTEYFLCIVNAAAGDTPATDPDKWRNVTARAIVPGLKSYLDTEIAGTFLETATGVINTGGTARIAIKKLFRDMPVPYKNSGVIIHAGFTDVEYLLDGQEDIWKYTTPDMVAQGLIPVLGTNNKCFVKPATWLGDSRRLIAQPMAPGGFGVNLVMGTDLLSDANNIKVVDDVHTQKVGLTVDLGFQIQDLSALRVGDQE